MRPQQALTLTCVLSLVSETFYSGKELVSRVAYAEIAPLCVLALGERSTVHPQTLIDVYNTAGVTSHS